jgi:hypothetical protein
VWVNLSGGFSFNVTDPLAASESVVDKPGPLEIVAPIQSVSPLQYGEIIVAKGRKRGSLPHSNDVFWSRFGYLLFS